MLEPAFDAADLRSRVTQLVERERCARTALRELAEAVEELRQLAPLGSPVRQLMDRHLARKLDRAWQLTA